MKLPNIFRTHRQRLGLSQGEIGALVGIDQSVISRLENDCDEISAEAVEHISAVLGIDLKSAVAVRKQKGA